MVVLVASIIEIVTTTTLAIGSKELVKQGAIVSRLAAIEDLAGMSILCSDKTGTICGIFLLSTLSGYERTHLIVVCLSVRHTHA